VKLNRFVLLLFICLIPSWLFSNTLDFPQVTFGGGYATTFVIMNTGTVNVSSRINFYDQTGVNRTAYTAAVNIPAGGSTRFTLPNTGPLTVVWGELVAGLATVQGVATFEGRADNGVLITTAGVLGMEAGDSFLLPVDVTPLASTGVAIANVNATRSINVRLRLFGEDGLQFATANEVRLNPLGSRRQIADFLTTMFPQLRGTTFKGTLSVEAAPGSASNSLAATALTVKEGLLSAIPTLPGGPRQRIDQEIADGQKQPRLGKGATVQPVSTKPARTGSGFTAAGRKKSSDLTKRRLAANKKAGKAARKRSLPPRALPATRVSASSEREQTSRN
jgi:hypothetical protein